MAFIAVFLILCLLCNPAIIGNLLVLILDILKSKFAMCVYAVFAVLMYNKFF